MVGLKIGIDPFPLLFQCELKLTRPEQDFGTGIIGDGGDVSDELIGIFLSGFANGDGHANSPPLQNLKDIIRFSQVRKKWLDYSSPWVSIGQIPDKFGQRQPAWDNFGQARS